MDSEARAALFFSFTPGIGPKTFIKLITYFQTAERARNADHSELKKAGLSDTNIESIETLKKRFDENKYCDEIEQKHATYIPYTSVLYPSLLKELASPPIGLFAKGNKDALTMSPILGVVGTRKVTSYGRSVTTTLVSNLVSSYGYTIISGLALGVDAIAHKATLNAKGNTIAVLGCGVDCCTPQENEKLYEEILERDGLIVSEYPLSQQPNAGTFPARNRIIAALSEGILVTEAGVDSGSLITAHEAEVLGRPIFAVPGPITSVQSQGTSQLLKQHATFVTDAADIVQVFGKKPLFSTKTSFTGTPDEISILKSLSNEALTLDELSKHIKKPLHLLLPIISLMEIKGTIKKNTAGKFTLSS